MKKILISIMTIGIAAAMMGAGTFAYFTDTDTSPGNTFTTGTISIAISGDSFWDGHSPGSDITISDGNAIFNFATIMPGDTGFALIDCTIGGTATADLIIIASKTSGEDDLAAEIDVDIWLDDGTIGVGGTHETDDTDIFTGTLAGFIATGTYNVISDVTGLQPIIFEWSFTDDGNQNAVMGDSYAFGLVFEAKQPS